MLQVTVTNERQHRQFEHGDGPLEFGRSSGGECERFVVEDRYVSRDQLRIQSLDGGRLQVENLGGPIALADGSTMAKGESRIVHLPQQFKMGYTLIEVSPPVLSVERDDSLQTIARPIRSQQAAGWRGTEAPLASLGDSPSAATLAMWFERLLTVQRAAAGSAEFYEETARAVVDLVGLDRGMVLLRENDSWQLMAGHAHQSSASPSFSQSVLAQVLAQKRTYYQTPQGLAQAASLQLVEAVVASPIFDPQDQVLGVVYGSRDLGSNINKRGIQPLEAQLVQLLAGAVSAGLARMEREAEANRMRFQFEQFVSPVLARELERHPDLLEGRDRDITVMFADLRGFSRISERLGPRDTYRLVGDVMDRLTERVLNFGGVIVDYYGDGLEALWNAPADQVDHAVSGCRAALAMQQELPELNQRWQPLLGHPMRLGIGLNSGFALVGNAGSSRRLKYGPRGHTVNLASRVEGATKQFGLPILISGSTRSQLGDVFVTRRLCRVRVVGIQEAVEIHELYGEHADAQWLARRAQYERALSHYESNQCERAQELLQGLLSDAVAEDDLATGVLASHIAAQLNCPSESFDPTFELASK